MFDKSPFMITFTSQSGVILNAPPTGNRRQALCDSHHLIYMKFSVLSTLKILKHNILYNEWLFFGAT